MVEQSFLAFDMGATSSRGILGTLTGKKLKIEEVARTPTGVLKEGGHLYWNIQGLFDFMQETLGRVIEEKKARHLHGIGVDTWGVDYALLDAEENIVHAPFNYRDPRNNGMLERAFQLLPKDRLFAITGLQMMQINSLFQLYAELLEDPDIFTRAAHFLHIADLLHHFLTGRIVSEYTAASTSQILDVNSRTWSGDICDIFGFPIAIFPEIVPPGTVLGKVKGELVPATYTGSIPVIAPASHDTGSAIAAVPATGEEDWAYISSGTWSLVGIESPEPLTRPSVLAHGFTNEGGVAGTYRVLKNVQGLWILQSCKDRWFAEDASLNHANVELLARDAPAFQHFIYPDHRSFVMPEDMPTAVQEYCVDSGQEAPETIGEIARAIMESLAFRYREVIEALEEVSGRRLAHIHIVGGGSKDGLLNQFAANACGRKVIAGPAEATAIGNILVQAWGAGAIDSLGALRDIVRKSFPVVEYDPEDVEVWDHGYQLYKEFTTRRESYSE